MPFFYEKIKQLNDKSMKLTEMSEKSDLPCSLGTVKGAPLQVSSSLPPTPSDKTLSGKQPERKYHLKAKTTNKLKKSEPANLGQNTVGGDTL